MVMDQYLNRKCEDQEMRIAAVIALGRIGGVEAADALIMTLKNESDPKVSDAALQAWTSIQKRSGQ